MDRLQKRDSDLHALTRSQRAQALIADLLRIVKDLERLYEGRHFTLDGHLVGSLGECFAEELFDIQLSPASTQGYDATSSKGRKVEIKATFGKSIAIRPSSDRHADDLIVLKLSRDPDGRHEVVYCGPYSRVASLVGKAGSNGQSRMSLSRLREVDVDIDNDDRVPLR